jgi:SAM-dependent methyltransferase
MNLTAVMDASSWDDRHAGTEHPWCCAPACALTSRIATLPPGRAIDLACGVGRHARSLADSGWHVEAVDFSPVAIEIASAAPDTEHVTYTVADVRTWQPANTADLVVIGYLHLPIGELTGVIATAGTWLAPGGRLLYIGHARENHTRGTGGPSDPAVLPDIEDLARAAQGTRVRELAHLLRPQADTQAVDILLHIQSWDTPDHGHPNLGVAEPTRHGIDHR